MCCFTLDNKSSRPPRYLCLCSGAFRTLTFRYTLEMSLEAPLSHVPFLELSVSRVDGKVRGTNHTGRGLPTVAVG
jgi:hypothetical protein